MLTKEDNCLIEEMQLFSLLIGHIHLLIRRQEFLLFSCACTSSRYPVALVKLQVSIQELNLSHPLCLLQENRQFGSKMTDSKYFTTTKKGMIAYYMLIHYTDDLTCKQLSDKIDFILCQKSSQLAGIEFPLQREN